MDTTTLLLLILFGAGGLALMSKLIPNNSLIIYFSLALDDNEANGERWEIQKD